ncbi:hypothetical protein ACFFF5_07590 [Lederbergia wuyishanensis]|uniref:Uncharacterized protein n=1 Tax=Lederbergia wuyishanensis TaxID=1347903 RepID=A0ABU0D248_9BACI|nr:hypothetical protein [Lederbergia wuyishanensis]MCJ8007349.1 hypothetical protein [Lederbergia wuyishanensis]MDQ0342485.1 hypothetical protein [Lederbergia wuyishanensis]
MIELALRKILKQVKSANPKTRYEALGKLYEYKQQDGLEVQIDVLKELIKTAASPFPERVDHWDNPSFYLIDFVCDFPMPEVVEGLIKHFDGFDVDAKERAIEFLLLTEDEEIFYFLEDKIVELMNTVEYSIPIGQLTSFPMLTKGILDATLDKVHSDYYKYMIYALILSLNTSGMEQGYKKEFVLSTLLTDYESVKQEYLKFNADYSTKYVFTAWKDSYLTVRNKMRLFIGLMEYYFSQEIAEELSEALHFNDPIIKTEALLVCIAKRLPYPESLLLECAEQLESAEMIYWELVDKNLEHLYPITEGKQPLLSKTRLFHTIANTPEDEDVIRYPEDIQVVDQIETENKYGQPIRYYLMKFKEHQTEYVGWVGGYALEEGDDSAHLWDGTYTDFVEFDSASIEKHKQDFFEKRKEEELEHENSVYFESSPKLSKGAWFFVALLIAHWFKQILSGFNGSILLSIFFTVVGGGLCLYELAQNKKRKIIIIGDQLIKQDGSKQNSIFLHDIKKVEYNKKHIFIYNNRQELAFKFPLRWVRYDVFSYFINEHTAHLKERPFIQS